MFQPPAPPAAEPASPFEQAIDRMTVEQASRVIGGGWSAALVAGTRPEVDQLDEAIDQDTSSARGVRLAPGPIGLSPDPRQVRRSTVCVRYRDPASGCPTVVRETIIGLWPIDHTPVEAISQHP